MEAPLSAWNPGPSKPMAILEPSLSTILINTYRVYTELFVDGDTILLLEGTTQSDPLAMPMYALATIPKAGWQPSTGLVCSHHILQDIGLFAFLQVGPLLQHTVLVALPSELLVAPFIHSGLGITIFHRPTHQETCCCEPC